MNDFWIRVLERFVAHLLCFSPIILFLLYFLVREWIGNIKMGINIRRETKYAKLDYCSKCNANKPVGYCSCENCGYDSYNNIFAEWVKK